MGKIHLLTKEQQIVLDEIKQNDFLRSRYYFTGGTVLSVVYLQHRYSEDIDLFSQEKLDNQVIFALVQELGQKHGFTFRSRSTEVTYIFNLTFKNGANLKVDFAYYPYKRLKKGTALDGIEIDSLLDIAVNKLLTISQRAEVKDFVDLYFLLQEFTVWDLMEGVRVKFKIKTEPFLVAIDFLKVEDFDYLPKMIKQLDLEILKSFFRQKAKELGKKSVE